MSDSNLALSILMLSVLVLNTVATKAPRFAVRSDDRHDGDEPGPDSLRHVH